MFRKFNFFLLILLLSPIFCITNTFADENGEPDEGFKFPVSKGPTNIPGLPEAQIAPERIIGSPDFEKMRDLPTNSQDYQLGRKVGQLRIPVRNEPGVYWVCTGFLVGPDLFMTNHHCVHNGNRLRLLDRATIYMDYYQERAVDPTYGGITARVSAIVEMDEDKDYALLRLDRPIGNTYGWLELDTTINPDDRSQSVKLISHPQGRSKEIVRRNSNILPLTPDSRARYPYILAYLADTEPGSSGSPVFLRDGTGVIAIHHSGSSIANFGSLMSHIAPEIQQYLPGVVVPPPPITSDLVVETPLVSNNSLRPGASFALSATVRNQGTADATATTLRFYQSTDTIITTSDTQIGTASVRGLAPNATTKLDITLTAPTSEGTYDYGGCVDAVGNEGRTDNNCSTAVTITVLPTVPSDPTPPDPAPVATTLEVVSGSGQNARVNQPLASPLVVRVKDQNDAAMSGVSVSFTVAPSGTVNPSSATTGANGEAETRLTLGSAAGTYTVTARASGITQPVTFTATATAPDPLAFSPSTIADQTFTVGSTIQPLRLPVATGGTAPYTYSLSPIPAGLSFNTATRILSGTPTTAATATSIIYTARDAAGRSASLTFTITVRAKPIFTPSVIADQTFTVGEPVILILPTASGGISPYTYILAPLPGGLSFSPTERELSGTPTTAETITATYTATDAANVSASLTFTITVRAKPTLYPSVIADQTFTVGEPVILTLPVASGGTPPYAYTLAPLPEGLSFNSDGRILSGTPTTAGTTTATYTATDAANVSASLTFTIEITAGVILDVNGDGQVTVIDLMIVALFYGTQVPADTSLPADVNTDGRVDLLDLTAVAQGIDAAGGGVNGLSLDDVAAALEAAAELEDVAEAPMGLTTRQDMLSGGIAYRNVAAAFADAKHLVGTGDVHAVLKGLLGLLAEMGAVPETTTLLPNYPNPFNPETWIPYHLSKETEVTVTIYDVRGVLVRALTLGHQAAGAYESRARAAYWDGRNESGESVASGLYFYTLATGGLPHATRKMLIAR